MTWNAVVAGAVAVVAALIANADALAQPKQSRVLDADYGGMLTCAKLPFTDFAVREPITVTVAGSKVTYVHAVRLKDKAEPAEKGAGRIDGALLSLQGAWKGGAGAYQAAYSGSFVRRSVRLIGTQTWMYQDHILTRACSGTVKRAFRIFLPRKDKDRDSAATHDPGARPD